MANVIENTTIKHKRNRYRLVISNDDSFEEIATFKLNRISVYTWLSLTFVFLVGATIALIAFTPLKFYIPGYGNKRSITELQLLKYKTDSLEKVIEYRQQYVEGIKKIFDGTTPVIKDTTMLDAGKAK